MVHKGAHEAPLLQRALKSESNQKFSACVAVQGRQQAVTGSNDGIVTLWALTSATRPGTTRLTFHKGPVTCVTGSSSGNFVASASTDGTAAVWRNQCGKQVPAVFKVHFSPVRACDISYDERLLLTASDDKTVKISLLLDRGSTTSFTGHTNWVRSAVFSPSAAFIASGGDDKTVRIWNVEHRAPVCVWHDHQDKVACVRFDQKASAVVACSWDSTINIWDPRSQVLRQHYKNAHGNSLITQVAFHPTKDLLLSSSVDRSLRIWDLRAGRLQCTIYGHALPVHGCCWESSGCYFMSCDNNFVHIHELRDHVPAGAEVHCDNNPVDDKEHNVSLNQARWWRPETQRASSLALSSTRTSKQSPSNRRPRSASPEWRKSRSPPSACAPEYFVSTKGVSAVGFDHVAPLEPHESSSHATSTGTHGSCVQESKKPTIQMTPQLSEALARYMEGMVSQMDALTRSLQGLETRLSTTEADVSDVVNQVLTRCQNTEAGTR